MATEQVDKEVLAAVFAARVSLAKKTREQVIEEAILEWERTLLWISSASQKEQSFIWFCDEFDLDASAVRRAIEEKR
jgi:hypothetical protein